MRIENSRVAALREVYNELGLPGVIQLAGMGQAAHVVGNVLAKVIADGADQMRIAADLVRQNETAIIGGFIWGVGDERFTFLEKLAKLTDGQAQQILLSSAPFRHETWEVVEGLSEDVARTYWSEVNVQWVDEHEVAHAVDRLLKAERPFSAFHAAHFHLKSLPAKTLYQLLDNVSQSQAKEAERYRLDSHYLKDAFKLLDASGEIPLESLALLEFKFITIFDHESNAPNLAKYVDEHPELFVQLVNMSYRRATEGAEDSEFQNIDVEQRQRLASNAHAALDRIKSVPGRDKDGVITEENLLRWVSLVRSGFVLGDRVAIGDVVIGKLLAHAPADDDGTWPCLPVRDTLEHILNRDVQSGFSVEVYNSRGVQWRGEGGDQERTLAAKYDSFADAVKYSHPRTCELLRTISSSYTRDAEWHDNDALIRRRLR